MLFIKWNFFSFLLFTNFYHAAFSIDVFTFYNNTNREIPVIKEGILADEFKPFNAHSKKCCQKNQIYVEENSQPSSNYTFFKTNEENLPTDQIKVELMNNLNNAFSPFEIYEVFSIPGHPNIIQLNINNACEGPSVFNHFKVTFNLNEKDFQFSFIKQCSDFSNKEKIFSKLTHTLTILFFLSGIIFFAAKYSANQQLLKLSSTTKSLKKGFIVEWYYGLPVIAVSIGYVFLNGLVGNIIKGIAVVCFYVVSFFVLYMTYTVVFKKLIKSEKLSSGIQSILKKEYLGLKLYKLISAVISGLSLWLWEICQTWITLDAIFMIFTFGVVSVFSFENYSNLILFTSCFLAYDIFWFCISVVFDCQYSTMALEDFSLPIKLVLPNYSENNFKSPCYFISGIDIAVTCMIVKYTKCFDNLKDYTRRYFFSSLILVAVGYLVVLASRTIFETKQIYLFPIQILLLSCLILLSAYYGEFSDFWEGKNNIGMRKAVSDIIHSVEKIDDDENEMNNSKAEYEKGLSL